MRKKFELSEIPGTGKIQSDHLFAVLVRTCRPIVAISRREVQEPVVASISFGILTYLFPKMSVNFEPPNK